MPRIVGIEGSVIKDSRGEDTIAVTLRTKDGTAVRASVPSGKSVGKHEAKTVSPQEALTRIARVAEPALIGRDVREGAALDRTLRELDGERGALGANTTLALSYGVYRAAARIERISLWRYLRTVGKFDVEPKRAPKILANLINGGLHADNNLIFQEYLVLPRTREVPAAMAAIREVLGMVGKLLEEGGHRLLRGDEGGYAPDMEGALQPLDVIAEAARRVQADVELGIDAAASNIAQSAWELEPLYDELAKRYPFTYLEDPFPEEDFVSFARVKKRLGKRVTIVGDDLTVTNPARVARARKEDSVNGIIVKPNQIGTVAETFEVLRMAHGFGWKTFVSHRSGETDDDFIVDLGYACGAEALKIGAPVQKERLAKYDRLVTIAKEDVSR